MFRKKSHLHFIGIGGIGMSGIARILAAQGYTISGCDKDIDQKNILDLENVGCQIYQGNNTIKCHSTDIDIVIYSSAISSKNDEITAAQARGIPTIPRALMLAELMRTKYSIAIAGSHGKTTTTSLVAHILLEAAYDPTVIIGGHLKNISTNAQLGNGEFLVAEADESDRSLTHLYAAMAIVTNIDFEHVDTYKDIEDLKATFLQFLNNIPFYGFAVVCVDNEHIRSLLPIPHIKIIRYGIEEKSADIRATDVILSPYNSTFNVINEKQQTTWGTITLNIPGKHNILNALAAIAVAQELGIPFPTISHALATFKGIERRFSFHGTFKGAEIFDDYGHHPEEIKQTLAVAHLRRTKKLHLIFQPHRYTRTHVLWNDFVNLLATSGADTIVITDIYAASEKPIDQVTSQTLVNAIREKNPTIAVQYIPYDAGFTFLKEEVEKIAGPGDLILLQGAGKINKLADVLEKS